MDNNKDDFMIKNEEALIYQQFFFFITKAERNWMKHGALVDQVLE